MKGLYVEDNPADATLALRALSAAGWQMARAATLAQARECLGCESYDAVLSDLDLPDGSGQELLADMPLLAPGAAFVMLTGSGDYESAVLAMKSGADDFLVKQGDYLQQLAKVLQGATLRSRQARAARMTPIRLLYLEHSAFDADLTRRHLAQHAPQVQLECLATCAELWKRLAARSATERVCDVLMLAADLPDANPLALAHELREALGERLPLILVGRQGDIELATAAIRVGFADYLVKERGYLHALPNVLQTVWRGAQLGESLLRMEQVLANSPAVIYAADSQGRLRWVSGNVVRELGHEEDKVMAPNWWEAHLHPEDRAYASSEKARQLSGDAVVMHYRLRDGAGRQRWVRDEMRAVEGSGGQGDFVGSWMDVSRTHVAEERVRLFATALENTRDGVMITDAKRHIVLVNRAFSAITGYREDEVLGRSPRMLRSDVHPESFYVEIWASVERSGNWQGEMWSLRRDGERYPQAVSISRIDDPGGGAEAHYLVVFSDISRLKKAEEDAERLAHFDPVTNLPNRILLASRLSHALALAERRKERVAVLLLDLDHFKNVNDGLGHAAGDALLRIVAERLARVLRAEDTLGRQSGDEFLILLEHVDNPQEAARGAERLLGALLEPATLPSGEVVFVRASIGIAVFPEDGSAAADLIRDADAAMYQAKRAGRNCYRFYTEALTAAAAARLSMEARIREALKQGELALWYQPLVALADNRVIGAEALLRWIPSSGEVISPGVFIPLLEETGMIVQVGEWAMQTAAVQAQRWLAQGLPFGCMAVNVSVPEIRRGDIPARLRRILAESGLPAAHLELEITESGMMEQGEQVEKMLASVKALGVRLAIDDFGTGYSSLAYLRRLPVDKLKIDRSFISEIPQRQSDCELAATIIAMAQNLRLTVLAEGVETPAQLEFLRQRGCDAYQGYLFGRPVPADEFARRFLGA